MDVVAATCVLERGSPTRGMDSAHTQQSAHSCSGERKPDAGYEFGLYVIINAYITTHQLFCSIFSNGRSVARNLPSTYQPSRSLLAPPIWASKRSGGARYLDHLEEFVLD